MNGTDKNNLTKYVFVLYSFHTQNNQHKPTYFQFFSLQSFIRDTKNNIYAYMSNNNHVKSRYTSPTRVNTHPC